LHACTGGSEPLAHLTHNLEGGGTLRAYPAEAAPENRQIDQVHERMYGFRTLSPRTPYICVWRDPERFRATPADGRPVKILMACSFGTEDWEPPRNLMEEATQRALRQEAVFGARWTREGDGYRLARIELEVRDPRLRNQFRSANDESDLATLEIRDWEVTLPRSVDEPLRFRVEVTAPYRLNGGEAAKEPVATLRIEGAALPIPDWLMY
jgi:hypothetical protein